MKRFIRELVVIVAVIFLLGGCAARPIHPGTANTFDSGTYDSIMLTRSVIESTKASLANNEYPASTAPNVKTVLNKLIGLYNGVDIAYCNPGPGAPTPTTQCAADSYHAMAVSGNATPAQQAALQAKVDAMNGAVTELKTAKGNQ